MRVSSETTAERGGVDESQHRVHGGAHLLRVEYPDVLGRDDVDPDVDVRALQVLDSPLVALSSLDQVTKVDGDQRPVVDGKVDVHRDDRIECLVERDVVDDGDRLGEQRVADSYKHLPEQALLAVEMVVQRRARNPDGVADVVDGDVREAALCEEIGGDRQQLVSPRQPRPVGTRTPCLDHSANSGNGPVDARSRAGPNRTSTSSVVSRGKPSRGPQSPMTTSLRGATIAPPFTLLHSRLYPHLNRG